MSKNSGNDQEYINKPQNLKIAFYAVFMAAVFLFELYLMIYDSSDYILLGVVGLIFLVFLYLLVNLLYQISVQKEQKKEKQYENIFKSEKASYMLLRKNFDELNEKVNHLVDNGKLPMEEMIQAQKAIAKVTINRNKENASAMLNSNDRLLEQVMIFDKKLSELDYSIGERQKSVADQSNKEVLSKQNEIVSNIRELELSLRNEILKAVNDINSQSRYSRPDITYREETVPLQRTAPVIEDQTSKIEPETEIEDYSEAMEIQAPELPEIETEPEMEAEPEIEIEPETEAEPEIEIEPEIEAEPETEAEPEIEFELPETEAEPEIAEPELEIAEAEPEIAEPEPEISASDSKTKVTIQEETPPMPDLSNPNKVMSPDEISALFANTVDAGTTLEESVKEEPPVAEEKPPVAEEKPPMPDLSNPNKVMSPEEIAALLANM